VPVIGTTWAALNQPLGGAAVPPVPAFIVRKYWVPKVAVKVALTSDETLCESAPASLQLVQA
jgi:hypothetical protein